MTITSFCWCCKVPRGTPCDCNGDECYDCGQCPMHCDCAGGFKSCECHYIDADVVDSRHCPVHGINSDAANRSRQQEAAAEAAYWSDPIMGETFQRGGEMMLQLAAWLGRIAIASVLWLGAFVYLIEWVK